MAETYWNIGKQIFQAQDENERAEYGKGLLKFLAEKLTEEFGKGYTVRNLNNMRAFYIAFPNWNALRSQLSWTHYRLLMRVEDSTARDFYLDECAKSMWSTRQLERQINSFFYQRLLASKDKDGVRDEIQTLEKGITPFVFKIEYTSPFCSFDEIKTLLDTARQNVTQKVNTELLTTYWHIGKIIVEYEQGNNDKAEYGEQTLKQLSKALTQEFGKGFSRSNL